MLSCATICRGRWPHSWAERQSPPEPGPRESSWERRDLRSARHCVRGTSLCHRLDLLGAWGAGGWLGPRLNSAALPTFLKENWFCVSAAFESWWDQTNHRHGEKLQLQGTSSPARAAMVWLFSCCSSWRGSGLRIQTGLLIGKGFFQTPCVPLPG